MPIDSLRSEKVYQYHVIVSLEQNVMITKRV